MEKWMSIPLRVLIVEDSEDDAILVLHELRRGGYDPTFERVDTAADMKNVLKQQAWDIVIADYKMSQFDGLAALKLCQEQEVDLPFIIVSGTIGEEIAVEAMKAGAHDYVMKDNLVRLVPAVERELREAQVRRERKQAELKLETHARQQAALFHLSADLVATLDETEICHKVVYGLHNTMGYDHVGLLMVDKTTGERVLRASAGLSDAPPNLRLRPGQGLSEQPLLDGRPHYTPDVTRELRYVPGVNGGSSEVDVPLKVDGKILGVLVVESKQVDAFNEDDFAMLTAAANQAAVALERAREHQAVKEAEFRYQSLFDRVPVGLYRTTPAWRFLDANPALVEMLDYPDRESFLAASATKLYVDLEDRQRWQVLIEREGVLRDFEVQVYRRDGTTIWVRNSARVVRDEGGQVLYYEGSLEDITEHKQAEEAIRRRNRELALLNQVIAASATSLEPETILEVACHELALAFDVPRATATLLNQDKMAAMAVAAYQSEAYQQPTLLHQSFPLENDPIAQYVLTNKTPLIVNNTQSDLHPSPNRDLLRQRGIVSMLVAPLVIEDEVVGSLSFGSTEPRTFSTEEVDLVRSVADQVAGALARARLGKERRQLSAAIEQTAESVVITDTEGVITYVNPAFEQVTGYSRAEAVGQKVNILKSDEQDDDFYRQLWTTISARQVWHGHIVNKKKDGTLYTDQSTITPVRNESGEIVNYVAVQRDVTRELELEEQLRRSQRMEAIGQLTAGIAHDFNNSLTAINGFAELIQQQVLPDSSAYEMAGKILHSGQHAADLVRQLLAFSRKQVIQPQTLNLNTIVANVDKMLQRIITETIELKIILAPELWPVEVDPAQMEQVIINLVVNARDAMPNSGKLTIETANVFLDDVYAASHLGVEPGEHILLSISDTGCGMSEEVQAHIFEPFFTTKKMSEGTGLGLSTVFGIVKQNKGNIWVYSEEGMGTTFKIYLPRAKRAATASPRPVQTQDLLRGTETILLVEDETMVRELAAQALREQGYTILEAGNGPQALRLAKAHNEEIHLLLTDVVMPQMSGKALADQLGPMYPNLKVLFTSGYADKAIMRHGILASDIMFIQKPFTPLTLSRKVREVLDR
jgi:two-component system cell cycle sensor histidine kinase/response regulator CckA